MQFEEQSDESSLSEYSPSKRHDSDESLVQDYPWVSESQKGRWSMLVPPSKDFPWHSIRIAKDNTTVSGSIKVRSEIESEHDPNNLITVKEEEEDIIPIEEEIP